MQMTEEDGHYPRIKTFSLRRKPYYQMNGTNENTKQIGVLPGAPSKQKLLLHDRLSILDGRNDQ
ncbi:hypothetical protein CHH77_06575 [Shouchella clausii]|nr:hypothetical protein CHH77_06575 [Shouchella clausii]